MSALPLRERLRDALPPGWLDPLQTYGEVTARQVYWRSPRIRMLLRARRHASPVSLRRVVPGELLRRLEALGVKAGSLVMVHASVQGLELADEPGAARAGAAGAAVGILRLLQQAIGPTGTLTMPTHALYADDPGFMHDKSALVLTYDPAKVPSRVGLLSEVFRRTRGVERSLHPLSPLAAQGPLSAELLAGNLNSFTPLPHGAHSGYYRFCVHQGIALAINTRLINALTIVHTPEEVRDDDWQVPGFFYPRTFRVRGPQGEDDWIVRERRPIWVRNIALEQLRRDLLREGVLRETRLAGVRIESARAGDLFAYMMRRNERSTYPYFAMGWR